MTTTRAALVERVTEKNLLSSVREVAHLMHVHAYHTHDSRRSEPGFPDLVLVGHGGVLWRELKTQKGRLTPAQKVWLDALTNAGQDAAVWRPEDIATGRVLREIARIARREVAS